MQDPVGSQNPDGDLFDLRLNSTGKTYALKFYAIVRISTTLGALIIVIIIVETVVRLIKLPRKLSSGEGVMNFVDTIYPYYSFVHAALASLLLYYYFLAGKFLKTGINYSNEESFNLAFKALFLSTVFSVVNFALTVIIDTPYFVWLIRHYL
jgi:hypothetical protein